MYDKLDYMIYCPNPKCKEQIDDDSEFCHFCGTKLIPENGKVFVYSLLFELMQLEETRRRDLDSKAGTYIGLLSISLTVLTAFGGIVTLRGGQIQEITNVQLAGCSCFIQNIIYILYISIVILFISAVYCAFRAYSTGSSKVKSNDDSKYLFNIETKDVYAGINSDYIADLSDEPLYKIRDKLIEVLKKIILINYSFNDEKSNKIKDAFSLTIIAISLLLLEVILIGLIGMKIL